MKTLKTKTIVILLVTVIAAMGLFTSCDDILEAYYPELTEMTEGEIIVYIDFDSNLYDINEFTNGTVDIKVAVVPFLEAQNEFYMQEDLAIIEDLNINDFQNRYAEVRVNAWENKIYKVIVWLDRVNDDTPDWGSLTYPEPSRLATNTWNGDWWADFRWGFESVEMSAYLSLGDEIVEDQLFGHPDHIGGDGGTGEPPVAEPWSSMTTVQTGGSIDFWENSWDPDGFIIDREWRIQGPYGDDTFHQPNLTYYFNDPGEYNVFLNVWDNEGNQSGESAPIRIYVVDTYNNQGPTSSFWADMTYVEVGQQIRFESTSWDPDDGIQRYQWNFGDETQYDGWDIEWHSYASSGSYNVELTVYDWSNESHTSNLWINVLGSGSDNRSIEVSGNVYGIMTYSAPVRIKVMSLTNSPGMEVASRVIWGATSYYEVFDYLPMDDFAVIAWWDQNNNDNPDPGEPGAFADGDDDGTYIDGLYGMDVPHFAMNYSGDDTRTPSFDFDNNDGDFLFSTTGGSEGSPESPLGLGINTTHYGGFVESGDYSYYFLDNLFAFDYATRSLEVMLMNPSADVDLEVYGASSFGTNYSTATGLTMIGGSYMGGTSWDTVNVPANHGYNSIFIRVYGFNEGSYDVNIVAY